LFGVNASGISTMMEIKSTGISMERFLRISRKTGFAVAHQKHYLFNPIYEHKFGIKPRRQLGLISAIPVLRNFLTMGVYYLMKEQSTQ
jgi:hypothetical protein